MTANEMACGPFALAGRRALVTGGGRSIGRAICLALRSVWSGVRGVSAIL